MEGVCAENQDTSAHPCIRLDDPDDLLDDYPWLKWFIKDFVKRPGQHLLELGKTGTGKTQFMYWMVDLFRTYNSREALVWFDIGKAQFDLSTGDSGNEILTLLYYFNDVRIITLAGCDVKIKSDCDLKEVEVITVNQPEDVWRHIDNKKINIISIDPFIEDDEVYSEWVSRIFLRLIYLANRAKIYRPLCVFYDEFHNVCPSNTSGSRRQMRVNKALKKNIQKLRSTGIRFVATTHQWTELYKPVRMSFEWLVPRRGTQFSKDELGLSQYNPRWRKMQTNQLYIVVPNGDHIGPFGALYYPIPKGLGSVDYIGIYGGD